MRISSPLRRLVMLAIGFSMSPVSWVRDARSMIAAFTLGLAARLPVYPLGAVSNRDCSAANTSFAST